MRLVFLLGYLCAKELKIEKYPRFIVHFFSYFCIDCNDFVGLPFAFLSSLILFVSVSHLLKMGMDGQLEIGDKKCSKRVRKEIKCVISILLTSSLPSFKAALSVLGVL